MPVLVSVIIPVYNGDKYLRNTIESVISQTFSDWEIVAVNDGSKDQSLRILEEYSQRSDIRFKFINIKNAGVSNARNIGVRHSEGEYLAFLDQDDKFYPDKLDKQIRLIKDSSYGLVYSNYSVMNSDGEIICQKLMEDKKLKSGKIYDELLYFNFIAISAVILPKSVYLELDGFDTSYNLCEDFDLLLKIARIYPVAVVKEPLMVYRDYIGSNTYQKIGTLIQEYYLILNNQEKSRAYILLSHPVKSAILFFKFQFLRLKSILSRDN